MAAIDFDNLSPRYKMAFVCAEYDSTFGNNYSNDYLKMEAQQHLIELLKEKYKLLKVMYREELAKYPDDIEDLDCFKDRK